MEIGHGFARPGRVTDLVRSSHATREERTENSFPAFDANHLTTKQAERSSTEKFRLILKYNLHDALHKANS